MKRMSEILKSQGKTEAEVTEALTGTVEEYQGKKLDTPKNYSFDPLQYESIAEAKNSEDWHVPDDGEILKDINRSKFTSAKAQSYQKETASLKLTYEKSVEFRTANLVKAAMLGGMSKGDAEALAASVVR